MKRSLSIQARLMTGLVASLTLVLTAGCLALYWSQREMAWFEFDRRLEQLSFPAFRALRPAPGPEAPESNSPEEAPGGLLLVALLDAQTGEVERCVPAEAGAGLRIFPPPSSPERPEFRTVRLASGTEVRVVMRRIEPPPRLGPMPGLAGWRGPGERGPGGGRGMGPASSPPAGPPLGAGGAFGGGRGPRFGGPPPEPPLPPAEPEWPDLPSEARRARVLVAGADLAPLRASLRNWLLLLLAFGSAGEALVVGVVVLAVRRGLRPLRALETQIAAIDHADLRRRLAETDLPGEVLPVVRQINDLLSRLEDAFARERAFTAGAAHEFRTPLAGIRTRIEVCLLRARTAEEYQAALAQCLDAAIALQRKIDALLDLARLDAGLIRPEAREIDMAELLRSQWARVESRAASRGCRGALDAPAALPFCTDPVLVEDIIANLLGNAAEYADPGGTVRAAVGVENGSLRLTVRNPAGSLEQADVAKLFDRFWRKDAARTHTGQHCGMGLAIARRAAQALGGALEARLEAGELEMQLRLPSLSETSSRP